MRQARDLVRALRALQPVDKSLGQHFLIDDAIIEHSVRWSDVSFEDHVLEIGPGPGVLTQHLLHAGCQVTAIEIDRGAYDLLKQTFSHECETGQLNLVCGDALTVRWPDTITKIVANIPYQISSPLIDVITNYHRSIQSIGLQSIVLLVQEEFAQRVVMEYESDVGSLGMVVALDFDVEMGLRVSPHMFSPSPKIHSRLIRMIPHHHAPPCDRRLLVMMIHTAFKQRRKKLKSTLKQPPRRLSRIPGWHQSRWRATYGNLKEDELMSLRPEVMELDDWFELGMAFESGEEES